MHELMKSIQNLDKTDSEVNLTVRKLEVKVQNMAKKI